MRSPKGQFLPSSLEERFWSKVARGAEDECWPWQGQVSRFGYGIFYTDTKTHQRGLAHRVAYELIIGQIPEGLSLDHVCHSVSDPPCDLGRECPHRRCVNPAHLEAVTHAENCSRGEPTRRTHCPHGHEYTPENTDTSEGTRRCLKCHREISRRWYWANREHVLAQKRVQHHS